MKLFLPSALLAGAALWFAGCGKPAASAEVGKPAAEEAAAEHDPLKIDKALRKKIGLKLESVRSGRLALHVEAYGRTLDPSPLAALVAELIPAGITAKASSQELARLRALPESDVSTRALQAAEAAAARDALAVESVRTRILLGWGPAVAARADLPAFVHTLASREAVLVRLDLPVGSVLKTTPAGASIAMLASPRNIATGGYFGDAPASTGPAEGLGYLFLVKENVGALRTGATVSGNLTTGENTPEGPLVPESAIVRTEGKTFVFVASGEEGFERKEVMLERSVDGVWLVTGEVKAGDKVVVEGAAELLSAGSKDLGE